MSHVQESLYGYENDKFMNNLSKNRMKLNEALNEAKDNKDEKNKVAKEAAKEIEAVLKKAWSNWDSFKKAAGDNMSAYKAFWQILQECPKQIASYNPKACYKLFNSIKKEKGSKGILKVVPSNYILASAVVKNKPCLVVLNVNPDEAPEDKSEEIIFFAKSGKAAKAVEDFVGHVKSNFKEAKQNYVNTVETRKKEEESQIKKAKLEKFLKESRSAKRKS